MFKNSFAIKAIIILILFQNKSKFFCHIDHFKNFKYCYEIQFKFCLRVYNPIILEIFVFSSIALYLNASFITFAVSKMECIKDLSFVASMYLFFKDTFSKINYYPLFIMLLLNRIHPLLS